MVGSAAGAPRAMSSNREIRDVTGGILASSSVRWDSNTEGHVVGGNRGGDIYTARSTRVYKHARRDPRAGLHPSNGGCCDDLTVPSSRTSLRQRGCIPDRLVRGLPISVSWLYANLRSNACGILYKNMVVFLPNLFRRLTFAYLASSLPIRPCGPSNPFSLGRG